MVFQEQSILPIADGGGEHLSGPRGGVPPLRTDLQGAHERGRCRRAEEGPSRRASRHAPARELTFADRQMVEIAKALSLDSRINGDITILLDEPTSVLERKEVELLFEIIADLKKRASIVFISHRLDEVLADHRPHLRDARRQGGEGTCQQRRDREGPASAHGRPPAPHTNITAKRARPFPDRRFSSKRAASARRAPSRMSASSCMKARCSALPASSARAARISPAASRATRRPMPERSRSTAGRPGSPPSRMRPRMASAWFRPNARSKAWSPSSAWRRT